MIQGLFLSIEHIGSFRYCLHRYCGVAIYWISKWSLLFDNIFACYSWVLQITQSWFQVGSSCTIIWCNCESRKHTRILLSLGLLSLRLKLLEVWWNYLLLGQSFLLLAKIQTIIHTNFIFSITILDLFHLKSKPKDQCQNEICPKSSNFSLFWQGVAWILYQKGKLMALQ